MIKHINMEKSKRILWSLLLLLALPGMFMLSGCKKFLDRKPLTATLDDLHQFVRVVRYHVDDCPREYLP